MFTNSMKQKISTFAIPALTLAIALGGFEMASTRSNARMEQGPPPVQPSANALALQTDYEHVAEAMDPSVVSITSREPVPVQPMAQQFQFPGFNFGGGGGAQMPFQVVPQQQGGNQPQFPQYQIASGSGMIVRSDGYILTNDHVVAGADKVTVTLYDGRKFVGKVFRDKTSDLAVIKIDATNLPTVQFANSRDVKVGELAIAFGSPFDLKDTMTTGIISSLNRQEVIGQGNDQRYYPSLLQTDASINPGNSGGPLVNVYGQVVGVDVAIESPSGGNVGIGFAIPSNDARYIMNELIENGKITRGFMGVDYASLTYNDKQRYGVKEGALITGVIDGSPAAKAGIQVQDVVTNFDNKPVTGRASFVNLVARTTPGSTVPVSLVRDGHSMVVNVTVGTRPGESSTDKPTTPDQMHAKGRLGIGIADVTDPTLRQRYGLTNSITTGALVAQVYPGSPAAEAGLEPGDVIISLNGKTIHTAQDLSDVSAALPPNADVTAVIRRLVAIQAGEKQMETLMITLHLDN